MLSVLSMPGAYAAVCGNGIAESGEQCDDGNSNNADYCLNNCRLNVCGDGVRNVFVEQCDDGNSVNSDGCLNNCNLAVCGDGILYVGVEQCDDGNGINTDSCRNNCMFPYCGDGIVDPGEQCEQNAQCVPTECDYLDGCVGPHYYNYTDMPNTCTGSCSCTANACANPVITYNSSMCGECFSNNDCNALDHDYCVGDLIMHDEGVCVNLHCQVQTTQVQDCNTLNTTYCNATKVITKDFTCSPSSLSCVLNNLTQIQCNDGLYCNGQESCNMNACVPGTPVNCADPFACTVDYCNEAMDSCVHAPNNMLCDNGLFCDGAETCSVVSGCVPGSPIDCSVFNIAPVLTCNAVPDNFNLTLDYFPGFMSVCNEATDSCTTGILNLTHSCDMAMCGAQCEEDVDCDPSECDQYDGCVGPDYYDYHDQLNTCDGCLCSMNACINPTISFDDPRCNQCQNDADCDEFDHIEDFVEFCDGKVHKQHRRFHDFSCNGGNCTETVSFINESVIQDCGALDGILNQCGEFGWSCSEELNQVSCVITSITPRDDLCEGFCSGDVVNDGSCNPTTFVCEYEQFDCSSLDSAQCVGSQVVSDSYTCNPAGLSCVLDDSSAIECDDGLFCNGQESCSAAACVSGTPVVCTDSFSCTADVCDEATDSCTHIPNHSVCDNGLFCDGAEVCDVEFGCMQGDPVVCDDGISCTLDRCDELSDACVYEPDHVFCDNGLFCDGLEYCDVQQDCQPGVPVNCADGVSCTVDSCDEASDSCVNAVNNALCSNGLFCDGAEVCDALLDCQPGAPIICDDGVSCTVDSCDESSDSCSSVPNHAVCGNGIFCDGVEVCDALLDCQPGAPIVCDDGISCTLDRCDVISDSCEHVQDHSVCSNGLFCDGVEFCDLQEDCRPGVLVNCADGVSCTVDSCDEASDSCVNAVNNALCNNGLFCDGVEVCDALLGCMAGAPIDCSVGNISGIAQCSNIPDGFNLTFDYRPAFTSVCDELTDSCTVGSSNLTHTCSIHMCGAQCESDLDCAQTECDGFDGCVGRDYHNYDDVFNTCGGCLCSNDQCANPLVTPDDPRCVSCGDGVVDAGEECDDGNLVNGDGCSAQCTAEPTVCTEPISVQLVIDRSGSMSSPDPQRFVDAKAAAIAFVNAMNFSHDLGGLVSFNESGRLDLSLSSNELLLTSRINGLVAGGATNIGDGILLARNDIVLNGGPTKVMILLSDGAPNVYPGGFCSVNPSSPNACTNYALNQSAIAKAAGIEIFTIGLGVSNFTQGLLQEIATDSAHYYNAPSSSALAGIYAQVHDEICANH